MRTYILLVCCCILYGCQTTTGTKAGGGRAPDTRSDSSANKCDIRRSSKVEVNLAVETAYLSCYGENNELVINKKKITKTSSDISVSNPSLTPRPPKSLQTPHSSV